jgi:hypothetical protein
MNLLPPPTDIQYDDAESAKAALRDHATDQGYEIVARRSLNYVNGVPMRHDLVCGCSSTSNGPSTSKGLRRASSKKTGCPFKLKLLYRKSLGAWAVEVVCGTHNHLPHELGGLPDARLYHRHNYLEQINELRQNPQMTARGIKDALKRTDPNCPLTYKDVENIVQGMRREDFGDYTAVQAILKGLAEARVPHKTVLGDENELKALFCMLDPMLETWQRFPHVMMMDVTHGTNRFNWKLLEISGITHFGTVFPVAFALSPNEDETFFRWVLRAFNSYLKAGTQRIYGEGDGLLLQPLVVLTDYAQATRNAVITVFPEAQLQLCTWHISKAIIKTVREKWQGMAAPDDILTPREITDEAAGATTQQYHEFNRKSFLECFRGLIYAPSIDDFNQRWSDLKADFPEQDGYMSVIDHIRTYYMPLRAQWARPWVQTYRNYGHITTSPNEAQQSSTKTFLTKRNADLYQLVNALLNQRLTAKEKYNERAAHEGSRCRNIYRIPLYYNVVEHLTWRALDCTHEQTKMAIALLTKAALPLKICTGNFFRQYGLPCAHTIISHLRLEGRKAVCTTPLTVAQFDPIWLLKEPLDRLDPYRRIRDPQPVPRRDTSSQLEGPRRRPQNSAMPLPPSHQPRPRAARSGSSTQGGRGTSRGVQRARKNTPSSSVEAALRNMLPGLVREVVQQLQHPHSTPATHIEPRVIDQPVPRPVNTQPRTRPRSEAQRREMQRLPSQFERYEPPRRSRRSRRGP